MIYKNTFINGAGFIFTAILNIIVTALLFRNFSTSEFASIAFINIFNPIGLMTIIDLSVPTLFIRLFTKSFKERNSANVIKLANTFIILSIFISLFIFIFLFFMSDFLLGALGNTSEIYSYIYIACCSLVFLVFPNGIFTAFIEAKRAYLFLQLIKVSSDLFKLLIMSAFIYYDLPYYYFCIVLIVSFFIPTLFYFLYYFYNASLSLEYRNFKSSGQILKDSFLIHKGKFWSVVFNNSDRLAALLIGGNQLLSYSEIFTKFSFFLNRFLGVASSTLITYTSNLSSKRSELEKIYGSIFAPYSFFVTSIVAFIIIFNKQVLIAYIGDSNQILSINLFIMMLWSLMIPLYFGGNILIGTNQYVNDLSNNRFKQSLFKIIGLFVFAYLAPDYSISLSYLISAISLFSLLTLYKKVFLKNITPILFEHFKYFLCNFTLIYIISISSNYFNLNVFYTSIITFFIYLLIFRILFLRNGI